MVESWLSLKSKKFQVRESPAPLNTPIPTPAPDRGGSVARVSGSVVPVGSSGAVSSCEGPTKYDCLVKLLERKWVDDQIGEYAQPGGQTAHWNQQVHTGRIRSAHGDGAGLNNNIENQLKEGLRIVCWDFGWFLEAPI